MKREPRTVMAKGKYIQLVQEGNWEYADRVNVSGVVAIVAVTTAGEFVLTEQYRVPVRKKVIDLPAGLAGDLAGQETEELAQAAQRELLEETGFQAQSLELITCSPPSPGMVTEMVAFFLARNVEQVAAGGGDASEQIRVHRVPLAKIQAWLKRKSTSRTCVDIKVYAGLGILSGTELLN